MTVISIKPVKECHGCALNLVKQCAIFEQPILKWKKRRCEGYNNPQLLAEFERTRHPEGARARKLKRVQRARLARTVPHSDGVHKFGPVR